MNKKKFKQIKTLTKYVNKSIKQMERNELKFYAPTFYLFYQEVAPEELKPYFKALYIPLGYNVELKECFSFLDQGAIITANKIEITRIERYNNEQNTND